ncbi:hypothetical protein Bca52824_018478 [Brassica carinata]|uniref:Uncharacterized protein n=1 Tax=Brassica carinata TaxID=52824 RepID=A0A8X7VQ35_BRACI|nr:hypothetical protein Bca52824_018478 [Brassica carinata]
MGSRPLQRAPVGVKVRGLIPSIEATSVTALDGQAAGSSSSSHGKTPERADGLSSILLVFHLPHSLLSLPLHHVVSLEKASDLSISKPRPQLGSALMLTFSGVEMSLERFGSSDGWLLERSRLYRFTSCMSSSSVGGDVVIGLSPSLWCLGVEDPSSTLKSTFMIVSSNHVVAKAAGGVSRYTPSSRVDLMILEAC